MPTDLTAAPSNIRVSVRWHDPAVFAGEEVRCVIVFRNTAASPAAMSSARHHPHRTVPAHASSPSSSSAAAAPRRKTSAAGLTPPSPSSRGHRSAQSLSVQSPPPARPGVPPWTPVLPPHVAGGDGAGHARSISVMSIGSATGSTSGGTFHDELASIASSRSQPSSSPSPRGGKHNRAGSLHVVSGAGIGPPGSPTRQRVGGRHPCSHKLPSPSAAPPSPHHANSPVPYATPTIAEPSRRPTSDFRFPSPRTPVADGGYGGDGDAPMPPPTATSADMDLPSPMTIQPMGNDANPPVRLRDPQMAAVVAAAAAAASAIATTPTATTTAKILSSSNHATGTPRSSAEFYSLSNNSSETLISEYPAHPPARGQAGARPAPSHLRRISALSSSSSGRHPKTSELLMMGYAQIHGSFTLDGSLVSLAPFEEVKRRAVVGGQGGGVIGVDASRRGDGGGGLLRGLGWSNITTSLGELLGTGAELSTIREMRGQASSRSVPLLSTPQSVLFVDLDLGPGESRTFEYAFRLPRGLPPTHRGKAIKISYGLVIGTQRPGGGGQHVRSVEVPFRVLGSVNGHGEVLGHDLTSPYVLMRDEARISSPAGPESGSYRRDKADRDDMGSSSSSPASAMVIAAAAAAAAPPPPSTSSTESLADFCAYVDELLQSRERERQRRDDGAEVGYEGLGAALLSPTAPIPAPLSRRASSVAFPPPSSPTITAADAINLAILRSNDAMGPGRQSPSRYEIARNGRRVAVVMLTRPAYRLGETVTVAIDFEGAETATYAVHCALETSERIDPSLANRSDASVLRVTRRVHSAASEVTLYSRRAVFTAAIPITATPEFITSGVSLEWRVRIEFVVPTVTDPAEACSPTTPTMGRGQQSQASRPPLLEPVSRDEKGGAVMVAVENLLCESFEVAVPLRVYGVAGAVGLERLDRDRDDRSADEGLAV